MGSSITDVDAYAILKYYQGAKLKKIVTHTTIIIFKTLSGERSRGCMEQHWGIAGQEWHRLGMGG
jgi:hypothetical protein